MSINKQNIPISGKYFPEFSVMYKLILFDIHLLEKYSQPMANGTRALVLRLNQVQSIIYFVP